MHASEPDGRPVHALAEFAEKTVMCEAVVDLDEAFCETCGKYDYPFIAYGNFLSFGGIRKAALINTIPESWQNEYEAKRYLDSDPVMLAVMRNFMATRWATMHEGANEKGKECLERAIEFGLTNGLTIPIKGPDSEVYGVSMSGRSTHIGLAEAAEILAICYLFHYKRIELIGIDTNTVKLTPKQKEYLTLLAEGKTIGEIATIFGISQGGVNERLREAYRRLSATNIQGAVARAMAFRLISPRVFTGYELED